MSYIRPVSTGTISASFDKHKARKPPSVNPGTDYAVPRGTVVVAPADGVVKKVRTTLSGSGAAGRYVVIYHTDGKSSDLLHFSRVDVKVGQTVKRGQQIGLSGGSANGSETGVGNHVHWTLRNAQVTTLGNVKNVDPEDFVGPANPWSNAKAVQTRLNIWRSHWKLSPIAVDGVIGKNTRAAITDAQKRFGITADGLLGPTTWARLSANPPVPAPKPQPEVKPEPKPEPLPEVKPEPQPEPLPEPLPEPEIKPEPELKPEPLPEPEQEEKVDIEKRNRSLEWLANLLANISDFIKSLISR